MTSEALVVGINDYPSRPLSWAVADARAVAATLDSATPAYRTRVMLDAQANRPMLLSAIRELAQRNARVKVLYLAGHAAMTDAGAYFVAHGCNGDLSLMVGFSEIAQILRAGLRTDSSLAVMLDCCHAGALEIESGHTTDEFRAAVASEITRPNIASLLACTSGAFAREDGAIGHGVFTYQIVNGLTGGAADSDGAVTTESLYQYVAKQLERQSYPKPAYKADLAGRLKLVERAPQAGRRGAMSIDEDVALVRVALDEVDQKIAELKPPFATRDSYRLVGWQQAAKLVSGVAEKRARVAQRWGTLLDPKTDWKQTSGDVDSLLSDIANITLGTVTEFGTIVAKIGEGGFGNVFKVESPDGGVSAYKVYHPHELGNAAKLERFRIGYRAMDRISHPRIVRVAKYLESPLSFYMDFIDGPNLRKWFGSETSELELIRIAIGIVQTVEYAHGMGVIHRDIKPENVILTWSPEYGRWDPVLTDFDLAWFAAATSHTVEAFGAPFYAAPEQLSDPGRSVAHQPAVDVYALAMLVVFLLTGRDPVVLEDSLGALDQSLTRWKSQSAAELLRNSLLAASRRKPEERTATARELRDELVQVHALLRSTANPDAPVDHRDFFNHVGVTGGSAVTFQDRSADLTSASGRTTCRLEWTAEGLRIAIQKTGEFLAEGVSTAAAKKMLVLRICDRLDNLNKELPPGVDTDRKGVSSDASAQIVIVVRRLPKTINGAALSARIVAELISVYEQF